MSVTAVCDGSLPGIRALERLMAPAVCSARLAERCALCDRMAQWSAAVPDAPPRRCLRHTVR